MVEPGDLQKASSAGQSFMCRQMAFGHSYLCRGAEAGEKGVQRCLVS